MKRPSPILINPVALMMITLAAVTHTISNSAVAANPLAETSVEPTDYSLLSHDLDVTLLRAGAHNGDKPNSYIFKVTAYGLINSAEERSKDLANRKKVTVDLGIFGESQLEPLAIWRADAKAKQFKQFHIEGKSLRELVARTMTELQVPESDVAIQTDVALVAKKKKYYLLNDDQILATVSYPPLIKLSGESTPPERLFTMTDDKGAVAKLTLRYNIKSPTKSQAQK